MSCHEYITTSTAGYNLPNKIKEAGYNSDVERQLMM